MKQVRPIITNANEASQRRSNFVPYLPTKKVSSTGATPMGAVARPDQIAVYPSVSCNQSGTSSAIAKNTAYASTSTSVPAAKLRCRNNLKFTIGSRSVSSQIRKMLSEIAATIASTTMKLEWNQSSSLPLSSSTCNEPTPRINVTRP